MNETTDTTRIIVDGTEVEVPRHYTLLQAAEAAGAEVPRFCFHERLSIAGNCRMCLVEVKGGPPKPAASCAMNVNDLRPGPNGELPEIFTNTEMVRSAREGVMEFLLINHPLDCPICDQGGECDLQDQAMAYGVDASRFAENKRAVEDKHIGPLVKTIMTRCIHCTRCVRFVTEVAGVPELGLLGRGEDAEITTYLERAMTSEVQGNVIDLCPVGALTARPHAFRARSWELRSTETIDVMDGLGSSIRVDSRDGQVVRILPRIHEDVNEEWISDKTRFVWDGLRTQRLDRPYVRKSPSKKLEEGSWDDAFGVISERVGSTTSEKIGAIVGDLSCAEEIFALRELMTSLGSPHIDCRPVGSCLDSSLGRSSYLFNSTISGIDSSDLIVLVGVNPRREATLLNTRIHRAWRNGARIYSIGEHSDLTYDYEHLGSDATSLEGLGDLPSASRPMIIVGELADSATLSHAARFVVDRDAVTPDWNGFNVLHSSASRVAALDLGFVPSGDTPKTSEKIVEDCEVLFLVGADEFDLSSRPKNSLTIYVGSHGDVGAHGADIVLPGATYTEKSGLWANTEGRVQIGSKAVFGPGREDWSILRALSDVLGYRLPFDSLSELREQLYKQHPHFGEHDSILGDIDGVLALAEGASSAKLNKTKLTSCVSDFYLTNPICRSSAVMAECSSHSRGANANSEAAE